MVQLEYLHNLNELSEEEEVLYAGIGKEFLTLIETTDMTKIYKMPVLYTFYNHGNVLLEITETQVLACWKDFFDRNKNWRDFSDRITYEEYKNMTDKQHLAKAKTMPIKFLKGKHEIIRIYESSIIFDTIAPNQGGIAYE